jgi:hypothetical protein
MDQRIAGRRPQVVEGGWLGRVIDQGVKMRFGRNGNGAEVESFGATREGSRRYGIAAEKCRLLVLQREARVLSCRRVWSEGEVECRMQLAECRYGAAVALAAGFTDWNCIELQATRGGRARRDLDGKG